MSGKPFWMKLILFVTVFMILTSSVLPTKVVYADYHAKGDEKEAGWFEQIICKLLMLIGTGIYALVTLMLGTKLPGARSE